MAEPDRTIVVHADTIDDIARRLDRLSVSRHDPHAFFEERSELVDALRKEAGKMRCSRQKRVPLDSGTR